MRRAAALHFVEDDFAVDGDAEGVAPFGAECDIRRITGGTRTPVIFAAKVECSRSAAIGALERSGFRDFGAGRLGESGFVGCIRNG